MAILFDFDGTLFDTSYDIHQAVNDLLAEQQQPPLSYAAVRSLISKGSAGILQNAIPQPEAYVQRLLDLCVQAGFPSTKPFAGVDQLLNGIEAMGLQWGIVTNRTTALTMPILEGLGYATRAACIVCGDTTDKQKPDPKPLLHACTLLKVAPKDCVYVGDALTDIIAGRAAGMRTIAAKFGFIEPNTPVANWQADHIVNNPLDILTWIKNGYAQ